MVITIFKGFKVDENPLFILIESILNFLILVDFLFRLKLAGFKRFFLSTQQHVTGGPTSRLWNWLDAFVVTTSVILFIVIISSHSVQERAKGEDYLSQASEIFLLVIWALFQTLRVIFIASRQRLAQQSAKTLIDFTHNIIIVDTDANQNESHNTDRRPSSKRKDEVIVFDMKQMEQQVREQRRVVGKEGTHFKGRRRTASRVHENPTTEGGETVEMQDMSVREAAKPQPQRIINIPLDDEDDEDMI